MLWWCTLIPSALVVAVDKALPYHRNAVFIPYQYGAEIWPAKHIARAFVLSPAPSLFNPSLALLPKDYRIRLNATFIAVFKHVKNQCMVLATAKVGKLNATLRPVTKFPVFLLLDDKYRIVRKLDLEYELGTIKKFWFQAMDTRLETFANSKVLIHASAWFMDEPHSAYGFSWLDLDSLTVTQIDHPDVQKSVFRGFGQNFGIMWNGRTEQAFNVLHWLGVNVDVRRGVPPHHHPSESTRDPLFNGLPEEYSRRLHNSGTPLSLDNFGCPHLSLTIGHSHINAALPSNKGIHAKPGETFWGNTYLQNFLIFGSTPPHATLSMSPAFCFPNMRNHSVCDAIQFVGSIVRLPDDIKLESSSDQSAGRVLITYGVNDCEAAAIEVSMEQIFAFSRFDRMTCTASTRTSSNLTSLAHTFRVHSHKPKLHFHEHAASDNAPAAVA